MKVLILTEGGGKRGFGHLTRCYAIAQAVKRRDGSADPEFIVNDHGGAKDFLAVQAK